MRGSGYKLFHPVAHGGPVVSAPVEDLMSWIGASGIGAPAMDDSLVFDTLLVAWVLGLALFSFLVGRALGASGSREDD